MGDFVDHTVYSDLTSPKADKPADKVDDTKSTPPPGGVDTGDSKRGDDSKEKGGDNKETKDSVDEKKKAEPISAEASGKIFAALLGDELLAKDESRMPTKPEPKNWTCERCTFDENPPGSMQCAMCGGPNKAAKAKPAAVGGAKWNCGECTFENVGSRAQCEMCGGSKPSTVVYQKVRTAERLGGKIVGFYFTAHWCQPCRMFTPQLIQFYNTFRKTDEGKGFEVVMVSGDRSAGQFDEYFEEMPWLAVPFADKKTKDDLNRKFKVQGMPTLVLVYPDGSLITAEARMSLALDPKGAKFPWVPVPPLEYLSGPLIDAHGGRSELKELRDRADVIGVYFSASWCQPCQMFTPELIKMYNKHKDGKPRLEIVFVHLDNSEAQFRSYLGKMPWRALPYTDERHKALPQQFKIRGIPTLVFLDAKTGQIMREDGTICVREEPDNFPWPIQALNELNPCYTDLINAGPCMLALFSNNDKNEDVDAVRKVAEEYKKQFAEAKNPDGDPLHFFWARPNKHAVLEKVQMFFRIPRTDQQQLLILDLPGDIKYFADKQQITAENVRAFAEAFLKNKDKLKQEIIKPPMM